RIGLGDKDPLGELQRTNHGENRIKHCVKYDLAGRCRLITVQSQHRCILLFVGDHNAADVWLDANKGKEFAVDQKNQLIEVACPTVVNGGALQLSVGARSHSRQVLYERMDLGLYDRLVESVPRGLCRRLEELGVYDEDALVAIVIEIPDVTLRTAFLHVFTALIANDRDAAEQRTRYYFGELHPFEEVSEDLGLVDSHYLKRIPTNDPSL